MIDDWLFRAGQELGFESPGGVSLEELGAPPAPEGPIAYQLAELLERPELLAPPVPVIPRVLYRERITLLAASWKVGKTTLLRDLVAGGSAGRAILGEHTEPGRFLWAALDEPLGDTVRGLHAANPDPERILLVSPPCTSAQLIQLAIDNDVDAVIIDTMSDLAFQEVEDENSAMQVKRFLAPWRAASREHGFAVCFLHHTGKLSGRSRGSGAIDALADLILTMSVSDDDPTVRKIEARGRVAVDDFRVQWGESGFALADTEPSILQQVRQFVWGRPGSSKRAVVDHIGRKSSTVYAAINALCATGEIENRGGQFRSELYVVENAGKHSGSTHPTARKPAPESPGSTRDAPRDALSASPPVGGKRSAGSTEPNSHQPEMWT